MSKKIYKKIVEKIVAGKYDEAEKLVKEVCQKHIYKVFMAEQDAQSVPGNKVTSVDKPGAAPENDGDTVGAGEGIPDDFEGKGTPETDGAGADGGSAPGRDDPGSSELDDGGVGEDDADYGPAVVTEQDDDEDEDQDGEPDAEEMKEFRAWKKAKQLAEQDDDDSDDDSDDDDSDDDSDYDKKEVNESLTAKDLADIKDFVQGHFDDGYDQMEVFELVTSEWDINDTNDYSKVEKIINKLGESKRNIKYGKKK